MRTYTSLFTRFPDQNKAEVFAHFHWKSHEGETWQTPFAHLAELAAPEPWGFGGGDSHKSRDYPILTNYLNHTFLRVQAQDKINYSPDKRRSCFNTGLQTKEGNDIYATFYWSDMAVALNRTDWVWHGFYPAHSDKLREFEPLPDIATYIDDPSSLVFDDRYEFEIDKRHILEDNRERLPLILQDNLTLALSALDGAVSMLQSRLRRDCMLATPHWYNNQVQLLMPLCITRTDTPDAVLVAERDDERRKYIVKTILTPQMAYINARVLRVLHRPWLQGIPMQQVDAPLESALNPLNRVSQ